MWCSITLYQSVLGNYLTQAVGSLHDPALQFNVSLVPTEQYRVVLKQRQYVRLVEIAVMLVS
jgi:hypothetical protein